MDGRAVKMLMVTPYPPIRDGIAAYAVQAVAGLRRQGHEVEVLSPGPSAAHHHLDLSGPRGALALAKRVRRYDRVIVQFHPDVFYGLLSSPAEHAAQSLALAAACRAARDIHVVVHEIDYRTGTGWGAPAVAARLLWRSVDRILLHSERERDDFVAAFGVPRNRVVVAVHGANFIRRTTMSRDVARRSLGLPQDAFVFLAIGFIQPHKGFDRAVRAFGDVATPETRLDIVGSLRVQDHGYVEYLDELRALVAATPSAFLHEEYVSDEVFDRWLVAADAVVLPYRSIWSSGVLERAALYDRPVIATAVGGLPQQAGARAQVTLVDDDTRLAAAMCAVLVATGGGQESSRVATLADWPSENGDLWGAVQDEVRRRAGQRREVAVVATKATAGGSGRAPDPSVSVRRLPPFVMPAPRSARPGVSLVKRVVQRLLAWELDPLAWQVNALRQATIEALRRIPAEADGTSTESVARESHLR